MTMVVMEVQWSNKVGPAICDKGVNIFSVTVDVTNHMLDICHSELGPFDQGMPDNESTTTDRAKHRAGQCHSEIDLAPSICR